MNKYVIDYGYGHADFFTEENNPEDVVREFSQAASICFGIRKSMADRIILDTYLDAELPIPYRDKGATHFLSHSGDKIVFKYLGDAVKDLDLRWWKLKGEWGDWCSCKEIGIPELACSVHHFYIENHDEICKCMDRNK